MVFQVVAETALDVCADCVYWAEYGGSGDDGAAGPRDDIRAERWDEILASLFDGLAVDAVMSTRDATADELQVCRHGLSGDACGCTDGYFSWSHCGLCDGLPGDRYPQVLTVFR